MCASYEDYDYVIGRCITITTHTHANSKHKYHHITVHHQQTHKVFLINSSPNRRREHARTHASSYNRIILYVLVWGVISARTHTYENAEGRRRLLTVVAAAAAEDVVAVAAGQQRRLSSFGLLLLLLFAVDFGAVFVAVVAVAVVVEVDEDEVDEEEEILVVVVLRVGGAVLDVLVVAAPECIFCPASSECAAHAREFICVLRLRALRPLHAHIQ